MSTSPWPETNLWNPPSTTLGIPSSQDGQAPAGQPAVGTIRVLHVINGEHYAGAERVQDLLAERLPEFGFEAGLACVKPDRFPQLRRCRQAPLYDVSMRRRFDLRVVGQLVEIARREDYQLLHAHTPRTVMLAHWVARRTGLPLVYHVHSPTAQDTTNRWRNWLNHGVERFSLRRAALLITVSASLARHMERCGYQASRLRVVPNGVPAAGPTAPRRAPTGPWTLGTVALLRPRKGLEVLLDALAILRQQGYPVQLRAVGPFETAAYEAALKGRVERLKLQSAVQWTGFAADVSAEMARFDLFVLPSLFGEGMPMVVLEAMAAGLPVVASAVEGVPEAVRDGLDGVLARPGDAPNLALAIARVVRGDLDWRQLSRSGQARQAAKFSDRNMAAGVAAAYREVLGGSAVQ